MRIPRQVSGDALASARRVLGYVIIRQTGSHLRLTCKIPAEHHISIPRHDPLRIGTLSNILTDVATFHNLEKDKLLQLLFEKA